MGVDIFQEILEKFPLARLGPVPDESAVCLLTQVQTMALDLVQNNLFMPASLFYAGVAREVLCPYVIIVDVPQLPVKRHDALDEQRQARPV